MAGALEVSGPLPGALRNLQARIATRGDVAISSEGPFGSDEKSLSPVPLRSSVKAAWSRPGGPCHVRSTENTNARAATSQPSHSAIRSKQVRRAPRYCKSSYVDTRSGPRAGRANMIVLVFFDIPRSSMCANHSAAH